MQTFTLVYKKNNFRIILIRQGIAQKIPASPTGIQLHCFFVPDFRDRLSALAELRCLVCAGVHGFPHDAAVPLKRIACPENREQKNSGAE